MLLLLILPQLWLFLPTVVRAHKKKKKKQETQGRDIGPIQNTPSKMKQAREKPSETLLRYHWQHMHLVLQVSNKLVCDVVNKRQRSIAILFGGVENIIISKPTPNLYTSPNCENANAQIIDEIHILQNAMNTTIFAGTSWCRIFNAVE